jgi:hypothetical protein
MKVPSLLRRWLPLVALAGALSAVRCERDVQIGVDPAYDLANSDGGDAGDGGDASGAGAD